MKSRDLLSEVLDVTVYDIEVSKTQPSHINYWFDESKGSHINIHELAHKCKEWAYELGYELVEHCDYVRVYSEEDGRYVHSVSTSIIDFDVERIFISCEWILEQKAKA